MLACGLMLALCGCSKQVTNPPTDTRGSTRTYNGTASVGDFMTLTLDPGAHTLSYRNLSNGDTGVVPFTTNPDGTMSLADPSGNLIAAYEVPNFVLLIQATKTGPDHNAMALVTAVQASPISVAAMSDHRFNYMQFRTAAGGLEVGSVLIDEQATVGNTRYWPFGAMNGETPFHTGQVSNNTFVEDSSGTFMRLPDDSGGNDYVFGTPNGIFAVDTQNGAILGLANAATKDFQASYAGSYHAIFYQKTGATTGIGNVESGTPSLGSGTVTISAAGAVTFVAAGGDTLANGTLAAIADTPYLYGPGQLEDPCNGLFTFRSSSPSYQQDFFVSFVSGAALFSSFGSAPSDPGGAYDYFYGAGLK
jgi:hypothetical protein